MPLHVIILAAGQGTRMRSALPKVLHPIAGRPMLAHVIEAARALGPAAMHVVEGHGGEQLRAAFNDPDLHWVHQAERLGTGHAVAQALPAIPDSAVVLVLYGDVPLIAAASLRGLLTALPDQGLALMTAKLPDPTGYGRILRRDGAITGIVEQRDADPAQLGIQEINTGILAAPGGALRRWVAALDNANAQGEYYLTDVVAMAVAEGRSVVSSPPGDQLEIEGVNNRCQQAEVERRYQRRVAEALMHDGLRLLDPGRFDLRGELCFGSDCEIDVNVVIEGRVRLGDRVRIGAGCLLRDVELGDDVALLPYSVLEQARVGERARIGPYARLRPQSELAADTHIGNFVEVKKSRIGAGSKVNHLSYIGDSDIGRGVNVGAGTITCNYDGANKHRTEIGDAAFIGSNSALVAPLRIGAGATIGAGSTITRDAPDDQLTLSRSRQQSIPGWQRPRKAGA